MSNLKITNTNDLPKCPYCEQELNQINKSTKGVWERHIVYMCPHCKKLLAIGAEVGFGN